MADTIPIQDMSAGLHLNVDPRLVPPGACTGGQNTRHHLRTIRTREGMQRLCALPSPLAAKPKLIAEYQPYPFVSTSMRKLLLLAGDYFYTADDDGTLSFDGTMGLPYLADSFNGDAAVQCAQYKNFMYFAAGARLPVIKWQPGDNAPVYLTAVPAPTNGPTLAITGDPLTFMTNIIPLATECSFDTGYANGNLTYPSGFTPHMTGFQGFSIPTSSDYYADGHAAIAREFTVGSTAYTGLEIINNGDTSGTFNAVGWLMMPYYTPISIANSDSLHLKFQLFGTGTTYPTISLQLGAEKFGDMAVSLPVSYVGAWNADIDAYVSLSGLDSAVLADITGISIKVDCNGGGQPVVRLGATGFADFSGYPVAVSLIVKVLEANLLTSYFVPGNVYNVGYTYLFVDPHDPTPNVPSLPVLESALSPISTLTVNSDVYTNPTGMAIQLPTPSATYNGESVYQVAIYVQGGAAGSILKKIAQFSGTGNTWWTETPAWDGEALYQNVSTEWAPPSSNPPVGATMLTSWNGRMVYVLGDTLYLSAWDNPDVIAPTMITEASGTEYGFTISVGLDGFNITGLGQLGSYLVVFKARSMWLLSGQDVTTIALQQISADVGCSSPLSVASVGGSSLIWRDGTHVYAMGGDLIPHDIGEAIGGTPFTPLALHTDEQVLATFSHYDPVQLVYVMTVPAISATAANQAVSYAWEMRTRSWNTAWTGQPGACAVRIQSLNTTGIYATDANPVTLEPPEGITPPEGTGAQVATPTFSVAPGNFFGSLSLEFASTTGCVTFIYTLDGSTPTRTNGTQWLLGNDAIVITATTTVTVFAYMTSDTDSAVATGVYTLTESAPTITGFTPTVLNAGMTVTITGTSFTEATAVNFNGVAASTYSVVNDTTIIATMAAGTGSGFIGVYTPIGGTMSSTRYTVPPPPSNLFAGYVYLLHVGLLDDTQPIAFAWRSAALEAPASTILKDVRRITAACAFADPLQTVTLGVVVNGADVATATKTLPVQSAPGRPGIVKWSPAPIANVSTYQAQVSGNTYEGGEVVSVEIDVEAKGAR